MSDTGTLRIHAQVRPRAAGEAAGEAARKQPIQIDAPAKKHRGKIRKPKAKLTYGDRLLRNSAYACALLLGVLALGNVNEPWAKNASDSVQ